MHGAAENSAADTDANAAVAAFELRFVYLDHDVTRTPTTSHQDPQLNTHISTAVKPAVNTLN